MGGMVASKDKKTIQIQIGLTSDEYELLTLAAKFYLPELNKDRDAANLATMYIRESLERIKKAIIVG